MNILGLLRAHLAGCCIAAGICFWLSTSMVASAQEEKTSLEKTPPEEQQVEIAPVVPADSAKQDAAGQAQTSLSESKPVAEQAGEIKKDEKATKENLQEAKVSDEKNAAPKSSSGLADNAKNEDAAKQKKVAGNSFYKKFVEGRLQFGTRSAYRVLTDSDSGERGGSYGSGTYLGTIYALDEKQNYVPSRLFLTYYFVKYIGLELAYDSIEAETLATSGTWETLKTDGDAILSGPTVSLLCRLPNKTSFTPYVGVGLGFFNGDFDEDASWASEYWDNGIYRQRAMIVESVTALLLTAGTTWNIDKNWFLDCSVQYIKADPDATFEGFLDGNSDGVNQTGHFPMDNVAFRLGVGYTF